MDVHSWKSTKFWGLILCMVTITAVFIFLVFQGESDQYSVFIAGVSGLYLAYSGANVIAKIKGTPDNTSEIKGE
jgi:hypothetical protein